MATFRPKKSDWSLHIIEKHRRQILKKEVFESFNISVLGLGNVKRDAVAVEALAAVFDLQGFTNFCKQIDPQLSVPKFLSAYLEWLMAQMREEMKFKEYDPGICLYLPLPFFIKFMGDGLLVIWDCKGWSNTRCRNAIVAALEICKKYQAKFYPAMAKKLVEPPPVLRCGLARGTVYSVGDDKDFVGSCINMAARLQKIPGLTFAFNTRGIDLEDDARTEFFQKRILVCEVGIRGIGDHEHIGILRSEYDDLTDEDKKPLGVLGDG